ncbi:hypothetical protein KSC_070050 [Ktedonobacter sp. SOSP1-52]|nr:hypothetical protein [Ktedonobacter sp. SOSP1-52]GHO68113.1 hypothetical protein KSC_070050 [Ktedonobacter sp. SOSP1-52]
MYYHNILETIGNTPLIELKSFSPRPGVQIFAKMEGSIPLAALRIELPER